MGWLLNLAQSTQTEFETMTFYTDTTDTSGLGAFFFVWFLLWMAVAVFLIVAYWKLFTKAGQPGWAALIPIYNTYVLLKIVGRPVWWLLLLLIPFVNIVITLIVAIDLAKSFGKDEIFGVFLLWLLSPIGAAILAFGDATYTGPSASGSTPTSAPTPPATPAPAA